MPLSSSPSTQRRRVGGGRGLLVNSIHGVDTLRYVVVLYRLSTSNHNVFLSILSRDTIVLYRLSTSNHNPVFDFWAKVEIVLYRLSTSNHNNNVFCVLSLKIVLYRLSTSNHNKAFCLSYFFALSYIVFLHQTTTMAPPPSSVAHCLISSFYIKPQHIVGRWLFHLYCLISSFYIKPQLGSYCRV